MGWGSLPLHICLLLLAKLLGQRVYVFFHGWEEDVAAAMIQATWVGRFLRWSLGRADYYSVLCERFRDQLIQAGWQPEDVVVLPLMVEVDRYQCSTRQDGEIPGADGRFRVLFLSRLDRDKGVWEMMEAISWLRRTQPDAPFRFVVAGDGPQFEPMTAYARSGDLDDVVQFLGYVRGEDKYVVYRDAELFVLPSFHEGFPTVVIEALAAGLPIVYTPVGALAEVLGPENGVCVELANLSGEAVGRELWSLYLDPDRRQTMAAANQRLAHKYDVKTVCSSTAELYRHVVELE
jgi:glycosyltransferase involved in cell wall biosynthesis